MSVTEIVQRLNAKRSGEGWKAKCPSHEDRDPSLSIGEGSDGRVLLKCFAGCDVDSICAAIKIRPADLFPTRLLPPSNARDKLKVAKARVIEPNGSKPPGNGEQSIQPRPLGELLDDVVGFLRKWVVFQYPEQAVVCALWALHTWLFKAFDYSPYLWVFAADMRSGKSRLLEVLSLLTRNPELTESGSSAALIRSIDESNPPTFLLDEIDCVYGNKKNDVEADSLRRFLNAGFKRGATFIRCVGQGSNQVPTKFPAFCPKAMAGIGRDLPATVQDRSVPIELTRQTREERADRLRDREARHATAGIRAELNALSEQAELIEALRQARPELPEKLSDRAQDIAEPLIAIADQAGGHWADDVRAALIKLHGQEEDASFGVKLLIAVKAAFGEDTDKLTTRLLLDALVDMEDGPWASMFEDALKHDKLQSAASKLARILRNYKRPDGEKIKPRPIKLDGETVRGFCRDDFEAAWRHWLPPCPSVTSVTSVTHEEKTVTPEKKVTPRSVTHPAGVTLYHEAEVQKVTQVTPVTLATEEVKKEGPSETKPGRHDCITCTDGRGHLCDECEAEFNAGKTLYPFNEPEWVRLASDETEAHWQAAWRQAATKNCEACEEPLADEPYVWSHLADGVVQCGNCREFQWWSDGFEVDEYGLPYCWNHEHSREQRIAERDFAMLQRATPEWKASDEGKAELGKARAECNRLRVYRRELLAA